MFKASANVVLPTSIIGSLPRPAFVLDLINDRPRLPPERYARELQAAVRYAVAMQEHAGLDVLTDGEWGRKSYIGVIAELAHGFELGITPDGRPWTVAVDRLTPKQPGFIANEVTIGRPMGQLGSLAGVGVADVNSDGRFEIVVTPGIELPANVTALDFNGAVLKRLTGFAGFQGGATVGGTRA